jgi:hypothetical protein
VRPTRGSWRLLRRAFVLGLVLVAVPQAAAAQDSLSGVLDFLLTNRAVRTDDFQRDAAAAEATRETVTRLLAAELATQPPSLSSVGFTYRFNSSLGTVERTSPSFGAFFTERSLTAGKGQAALGVNLRVSSYQSLDGRDLRDGRFLTTANQFRDERTPFDEETLTLELQSKILTFTGTYGVTDRLDVSAAVPIVSLSLTGERVNTYYGASSVQAAGNAHARGVGDIAVRAKYGVIAGQASGLAVAGELRLPTGREIDLLGAGESAFSGLVIGSFEGGAIGGHGNLSVTRGGVSDEIAWRGAVCFTASEKVTLVGELLGRRLGDVGRITPVRAAHPTIGNVDTIRLIADDTTVSTTTAIAGARWNVGGTWILSGHVAMPLTDRGLRSGVVALVGIDYALGQ